MHIHQGNGPHSQGIKLTDNNGNELTGISSVDIRIRPNETITAELEIAVETLNTPARAEWYCHHPVEGGMRKVKRIEFEDGFIFEAGDHA